MLNLSQMARPISLQPKRLIVNSITELLKIYLNNLLLLRKEKAK